MKMFRFRQRRLSFWCAALVMVVAAFVFVPMEEKASGPFRVRPSSRAEIRAPVSGFLQTVFREEGQDVEPGTPIVTIAPDKVFIGSCTNARIEDLRAAASVVRGHRVSPTIKQALVVPGSGLVKAQAEAEGLDRVFTDAGFEWREPGCSMCLGMNDDRLGPGERCASTSNRNFEGRQGAGGRTHLVSPVMAVADALAGRFVDVTAGAV